MKIIYKRPPNYNQIKGKFKFDDKVTIFAYGNIIYNPSRLRLPKDVIIHEEVHEKQQSEIGVSEWWERYLEDDRFRLEQEIEAYREQYRFRGEDEEYLDKLADILSGSVYGNIISKEEAKNEIRKCVG